MVHRVNMVSVSWKIPQANNEDLMKERKHDRFFDTFELCLWPICPQKGFIYIHNISVAQIIRNQVGDAYVIFSSWPLYHFPRLYQCSIQPDIVWASWDNVYLYILPYILLTIRYWTLSREHFRPFCNEYIGGAWRGILSGQLHIALGCIGP